MQATLETLLQRLRDRPPAGDELPALLARARALVAGDDRIPAELREVVFVDLAEASSDAAGLLAVLGRDDLGELLGAAIASEGALDTAAAAQALAEAEWAPIGLALREAVRVAAGEIDVVDEVMAAVQPSHRIPTPANTIRRGAPPRRAPSNPRPWAWTRTVGLGTAALAAAAAAFVVSVGRGDLGPSTDIHPLIFAQAGEVVIEDLAVAEGVQVIELEGADGSLILWVDEGAS